MAKGGNESKEVMERVTNHRDSILDPFESRTKGTRGFETKK